MKMSLISAGLNELTGSHNNDDGMHTTRPQLIEYRDRSNHQPIMPIKATEHELDEPLYPDYMPTMNTTETFEEMPPFEHDDPAFRADPTFPNLLSSRADHRPVTPLFGTEITNIQLTKLDSAGLDELALLCAQRGFVVFRNQDWKDAGFKKQLDIGRHFGPLHKHPVQPRPATETEISVIYQSAADTRRPNYWGDRLSGVNWHVDQTHERQPPGVTFFGVLENQGWCGGDTVMSDSVQLYRRMSPVMQKMLIGLRAIHSSSFLTNKAKRDGEALRRQELNTSHPVITKHPVTGDEILYVNEVFTTSIEGMKTEESKALLKFLVEYVARALDCQARVKWEEGTVVVWDQRRAQHTALLDTPPGKRRHMIRITPLSNVPIAATLDA
ncbi:alpha-ketoglutarate catabolism dioxygenase [Naematelia encephala]|uniref:Alpha-ketoglutarate catabolism dioxygenase n=1 Tax=Naematelia encephala TaxID=71784 RepID=A0A1Y2AR93_9TREE|nr:alpha-ketoglutarate catabolism dioxygenase [Naematelia encephala]